ncbi:MAG: hypothetical protein Q7T77_03830 [Sulfuricurvum sp.]|nr:hypothetical protein [Sulfuricurvum sp.]
MRYNHANGFNRKSMQELKYDLIDVMYFYLEVLKATDDPNLISTYDAMIHETATSLVWIDALKNGLVSEEDMVDSAIKYVTDFHKVSMLMIDAGILHGERYENFCVEMDN